MLSIAEPRHDFTSYIKKNVYQSIQIICDKLWDYMHTSKFSRKGLILVQYYEDQLYTGITLRCSIDSSKI